LNLTRNAVQAMEQIAAPLGLSKLSRPRVEIVITQNSDGQDEQRVQIMVMDRGTGVPIDMQEQLFDAFKSNKHAGMGIGLSFCRSVMEQLGGSIQYQARPQGGSNFILSLPTNLSKVEHASNAISV
jgi:signal transduction histidine kinase